MNVLLFYEKVLAGFLIVINCWEMMDERMGVLMKPDYLLPTDDKDQVLLD